jgi:hypothetical protein
MARVALELSIQPGRIEVFVRLKANAGHFEPAKAIVDTGASVSLFPLNYLDDFEHVIITPNIEIEQAGIAGQYFKAIEAEVTIYLEDRYGDTSPELTVRAWFADTDKIIIGFQDILDRATLYADFRQSRTGWIEL